MYNNAYKIEQGVPMPQPSGRGKYGIKYPFKTMKVGESFLVPCADMTAKNLNRVGVNIMSSAKKYKNIGVFTTRRVADGVRCWKVSDNE